MQQIISIFHLQLQHMPLKFFLILISDDYNGFVLVSVT
ncbi:hypothetical protein SAMN05443574_1305 [Haloarcula vallismortis]|uniref:Uncharacterized protein n=1 Tax=Haloarcula vallismortis TaxID=28442 RepID=A0A1H3ASF6_HALVA|nr:hypothetical protein SAMN05443574_1305 [Haloarcula vallismortis]